MDILSGIKDIQTSQIYKPENVKNDNQHIQKVEKQDNIQKEIEKKSKEDIKKELQHVIEELNKQMNPLNTDLEFRFNDKIEELTVQVIDKKHNKVIREFPPKEAIKLMEKMRELVGMLFDKKG